MPQTRSARDARTILLFKSFGDDVLNHILATVSFADRSAITSVCKQWRHVVASKPFERARRAIGETGTCLVYCYDNGWERDGSLETTPSFLVTRDGRLLRGPGRGADGFERCAVLGDEVMVIGGDGMNHRRIDSPLCHMHAFNVSKGTWRTLAAPPVDSSYFLGPGEEATAPVEAPGFAVVAGRLFCAGGSVITRPPVLHDAEHRANDRYFSMTPDTDILRTPAECGVYEYDVDADEWRLRAEMEVGVWQGACAALGNKLYVIGGANASNNVSVPIVQVYDVGNDTWTCTTLFDHDNGAHIYRWGAYATVVGGEIWFSGSIEQELIEMYDPEDIDPETGSGSFYRIVPDWESTDENAEQERKSYTPPDHHCPSGCIDGKYAVFGKDNTIKVLEEDCSCWTTLVHIPGDVACRLMASHVPLI